MRTKFLSTIASSLILSLAITSCLGSDNNGYELSSDNIITAFALDTIYGKTYKFTINQYGGADGTIGEIYNIDSIPYSADTIINKILIKTLNVGGYITAGDGALSEDTMFNYTDSLNFTNTMEKPLTIRVRSYDDKHIKEYRISVRRHLVNPDSLVWGGSNQEVYTESFSGGKISESQEIKAVVLNSNILVYTAEGANITMYEGPIQNGNWPATPTNLPTADTKISSILNFDGVLYTVTTDNKVLSSTSGTYWQPVTSDTSVDALLTVFSEDDSSAGFIAGITTAQEDLNGDGLDETVRRFSSGTFSNGTLVWRKGEIVPEDEFPHENISAIKSYKTNTGIQRAMLVGKPKQTNPDTEPTKTIPWFSIDGLNWAPMESVERYSIPVMEHPSIIYYGKTLYAFGDDFSYIYTSLNGLVWEITKKDFLFPNDKDSGTSLFKGRGTGYSTVIDSNNYIWMIWCKAGSHPDEVWRAKMNKLGFIIQN